MTNGGKANSQINHIQFATGSDIPLIAGHTYQASVWVAQVHCTGTSGNAASWMNAEEVLSVLSGTTALVSVDKIPCTDSLATSVTMANDTPAVVQQIQTAPFTATASGNVSLQLENMQQSSVGNDVAFDLPMLKDLTPQLYKDFYPKSIVAGTNSVLTFVVRNTDDLGDKSWSFEDPMPSQVTLVSTTPVAPTDPAVTALGIPQCTSPTVTQASASDFTVAGTVSGVGCTVSFTVTSATDGPWPNTVSSTTGLTTSDPDGTPTATDTLTVTSAPAISLVKTADPTTATSVGQVITYTFVITNTGNVPLAHVMLQDPDMIFDIDPTTGLAKLTCDSGFNNDSNDTLAVNAPPVTCQATHTVTAADLAAGGQMLNTATAQGTDPANPASTFTLNDDGSVTYTNGVSSTYSAAVNMAPPVLVAMTAVTGGSISPAMVLWPMLALVVTGVAVWMVNWRRKLAA